VFSLLFNDIIRFNPNNLADRATSAIEKDVHRTDRHIPLFAGEDIPHPDPSSPFHNPDGPGTNVHMEQLKDMLLTYLEYDTPPSDNPNIYKSSNPHPQNLGYVQGMSDLLSPLYAVFQDDAVAFWAFVQFMQRMSRNFVRSQQGMRAQLSTLDQLVQLLDPKLYLHLQSADSTNFFFFFRMLLVWYKREFDWPDVLRLWEALWTDYMSSQFHLFIAMAILEKHRTVIMEHLKHFDEVLKYINELSGTIELKETLIRAEGLFKRFERTVGVVDRQTALPTPNEGLRNRKRKPMEEDLATEAEIGRLRDRHDKAPAQSKPGPSTSRTKSPSKEEEDKKVITQQLRQLMERKVFWYPE
jgi:TBC1 domain family member 15